jgi:hypothetical protein
VSSQAPRLHVAPQRSKTFGDLAADFSAAYELDPDPWQRLILDDWLGEHRGKWAALTCGLSVPRQNGKNAVLEMRELFGMVGRGEKILHTAHQVKTAQKHFRRLKHFFGSKVDDPAAKFPELNALVREVRNVNGQEAIYLENGGSVEIVARSQGSGRGFTVDVIVCDEAQDMGDDDQEALLSTSSASPLRNPQWIYTGTPPGPKAVGEVFTRIRSEILDGRPARKTWHEWSAEPDTDSDDRAAWRSVNPGLEAGRLQVAVIEGERANLSEDGFRRERLGMWPSADMHRTALPYETWKSLADPDAPRGDLVAFGADVAEDRTAWVAVAWTREDGAAQVMLGNEGLPLAPGDLAAECERLTSQWGGVVVPPKAFEDDFTNAGAALHKLAAGAFTSGCGSLADRVAAGTIHHGNQQALNDAVKVAKWRSAGTSGERAFQLKDFPEVGPLAAVVRALCGLAASVNEEPAIY